MTFTWHFFTGGEEIIPVITRKCHRGPMIDVEVVMSRPFVRLAAYNTLRQRLLEDVVDSVLPAVQTREIVLRSINSLLGPMIVRLASQKQALQVLICEKKNSLAIESDLADISPFYFSAADSLLQYNISSRQTDLFKAALTSNSPIMRVAGKCAVILLCSFIEMDYQNG